METKEKMEKLGILLARSPIDDGIKKLILDNLQSLKISDIDLLILGLEREQEELLHFSASIDRFFKQQDEDWKNLEYQQKVKSSQMLSDFLQGIQLELAGKVQQEIK